MTSLSGDPGGGSPAAALTAAVGGRPGPTDPDGDLGPGGRRLPVTVVSGFLGSGKTTLVNRILTEAHGLRIGVLVNEFGEIGIDGALIRGGSGQVVELANGCLCCDAQGRLPQALAQMAREGADLDGLIVEASGLAEPLVVADVLLQGGFARDLVLDGVVTLVDCANFDANLAHASVAYQQLVGADLLVLTKVDLAGRATAELLRERLGRLNRRAGVVIADGPALPLGLLLGIGGTQDPAGAVRRGAAPPAPHTGGPEVRSVTVELDHPLDQRRFTAWAQALAPEVFRAKGILRFGADPRPLVFHQVGARQDLDPAPPAACARLAGRGGLLVLFGAALDGRVLRDELAGCAAS